MNPAANQKAESINEQNKKLINDCKLHTGHVSMSLSHVKRVTSVGHKKISFLAMCLPRVPPVCFTVFSHLINCMCCLKNCQWPKSVTERTMEICGPQDNDIKH